VPAPIDNFLTKSPWSTRSCAAKLICSVFISTQSILLILLSKDNSNGIPPKPKPKTKIVFLLTFSCNIKSTNILQ
jgi:hypothetical protein